MSDDSVNIEINGTAYVAPKGAMIIQVADDNGILIPRFCYHKKLSVAANCRMCLVEVEKAPKPLPACATPVNEGMKVFTRSPLAIKAQKSVMEFLLINHPLDCPICDQGGECELQDVAMGYGRDLSRFTERKRVVPDKNLGPLIATDMTRCIHCTRCVRFGAEIGGMPELGMTGRGENARIGTFIERSVDSELSGNMIDVCPVGALTSKPFRFRARAWEMQQRDTIAPHDTVGSNLHLHVKGNRVMRVVPKENEAVNEVWLSDRDRFSYDGLYSSDRLLTPMLKLRDRWEQVDWETALSAAVERLQGVVAEHGAGALGALASPSATTEEHYLLQRLMRGMGSPNIDHRVWQSDFSDDDQLPLAPWLGQALATLEDTDAALLIGSNVRFEQPMANHRLRKAARAGAGVMLVNSIDYDTNFDIAHKRVVNPLMMADELASIARASAQGSGDLQDLLRNVVVSSEHERIAEQLRAAERGVVLMGPSAMAHPHAAVIRALAGSIATATGAVFGYLPHGANSVGASLAGMLPHRLPGGGETSPGGLNAFEMFNGKLSGYVLLGLEPELDCVDSGVALSALRAAASVVCLTAFRTPAMDEYADVLLPIAPFAETPGSYVNVEGRWQRFAAAVSPQGEARPAWKVLRVLGNLFDVAGFDYVDVSDVHEELRELVPAELPTNAGGWRQIQSLPEASDARLVRIGDMPLYAVDPVVRRAAALQQTQCARQVGAKVNENTAKRLQLEGGMKVGVAQNGSQVTLDIVIDPRVADGCVQIHGGVAGSVGLGPSFGPVALRIAQGEPANE
jgi:NADH-quinone oxidoreductase subunit G